MSNNPVQCWVDVESPAGAKLGHGPLLAVTSWTSTALLSKAGSFTLTLAAADPQIDLLQPKRVLRCWALVNGTRTEIGAGIVDEIKWGGGLQVTVSGSDLLGELRYRSVHDLAIYAEALHSPTRVIWYDGAGPYWNNLPGYIDGDLDTSGGGFNLAGSNSFLYVGYAAAPWNVLYTYQAAASYNTQVAGLHYGYSVGGDRWPELKIFSDTQYDPAADTGIPWPAALLNNIPAPFVQVRTTVPGGGGANEVQTVTLYGAPATGTFALAFGAATTAALAGNVSAAAMQTALQALASIGSGNATVTRSGAGTLASPYIYTVTFVGALANTNVAQMTVASNTLIGGDGTGAVLFKLRSNWAKTTVDGTLAYWLRIDPDANLTAPTAFDEVLVGIRTPRLDDLQPILDLAPAGWSFSLAAGTYDRTVAGTNAVFAGESVLSALVKIAENSGESFRLGAGRTIEWLHSDGTAASFAAAGVRAMNNTGSERQAANPLTCQIVKLEETRDTNDLVTRVYPFGPGNGTAQLTLADATLTMPTAPDLYELHTRLLPAPTAPATANPPPYYIVNATAAAASGRIERVLSFKDIDVRDENAAANNLAQAALTWLKHNSTAQRFYRLEVVGLKQLVKVGTLVHIIYREVHDGRVTVDIDEQLIVLGATHTFAAGEIYTTSLDVGTSDAWPATDAEVLADMIEDAIFYAAYPQDVPAAAVVV